MGKSQESPPLPVSTTETPTNAAPTTVTGYHTESHSCERGTRVKDLGTCQAGFTIGSSHYKWKGWQAQCRNDFWPDTGCFAYGTDLYYSTCTNQHGRSDHHVICGPNTVSTNTVMSIGYYKYSRSCQAGSRVKDLAT